MWPAAIECIKKLADKDKGKNTWPVLLAAFQKVSSDFNAFSARADRQKDGNSATAEPVAPAAAQEEDEEGSSRLSDLMSNKERTTATEAVHTQLFKLLGELALLTESKSKEWIDFFEEFVTGAHQSYFLGEQAGDDTEAAEAQPEAPKESRQGRKAARRRLLDYLELFGLFKSPSALKKSTWIHGLVTKMLGHSDSGIQLSALKALLTWKSPAVKPYQEHLLNLLDKKKGRDTMTHFSLAPGVGTIDASHRGELIPVVCRLILGRILDRSVARGSKKDQHAGRRMAYLSYLGNVSVSPMPSHCAHHTAVTRPFRLSSCRPLGRERERERGRETVCLPVWVLLVVGEDSCSTNSENDLSVTV